ncbi:MAG: AbgT family transporter [Phycisphaeraceae bacterium]|nr:AbgT family transporter [Phycisphaeraceae bacterium]
MANPPPPRPAPPTTASGQRRGLLDLIEWLGNKLPEPTMLFIWGIALVLIVSQVGMWQGWQVRAKKLQVVTAPQLDEAGRPVLDRAGNALTAPVLDSRGRPVTELVDDLSRNDGEPFRAVGLLSGDGAYWAISSLVDNFVRFAPLGIVLVGMLGIGVAERSGFIGAALKSAMVVVPPWALTPAVIFLGIMSSLGTDAGYVVLPPIAAVMYRAVGRSPLAGIAAVFAGVAAGFNANLLITSLDPLLAGLTQMAARTIDPDYAVNPACNWYFMIASTVLLPIVGWLTSDFIVEKRLSARPESEGGPNPDLRASAAAPEGPTPVEKRGLRWAGLTIAVLSAAYAALVLVPRAPMDDLIRDGANRPATVADGRAILAAARAEIDPSITVEALTERRVFLRKAIESQRGVGPLVLPPKTADGSPTPGPGLAVLARAFRDADADEAPLRGLRKLPESFRGPGLGDHFPRWVESIVPMLFILFLAPGLVFGAVTGSVRTSKDMVAMMTATMSALAPIIVLSFFAAQFVEYFAKSQLDKMLAYKGGEMLASASLPTELLIVAFIGLTMVFNLFVGSMSAKYTMFAPIFVPMLMLLGISPELTQVAYRVGDSTTNVVTPLNSYLVIILVVMQKYAPRAGIGTLISMMLPYTILFTLAWTVMLLVWMQIGAPLGPGGSLTFAPGV